MAIRPIATTSRIRTRRSSSRWSGERRRSRVAEAAGDPPDLGRGPVATTTPSPRPPTTLVPAYAIDRRSASGASGGVRRDAPPAPAPIRRSARSDRRAAGPRAVRRRSAGTTSPARSEDDVARRRSRPPGRRRPTPSRRTRAVGAEAARSASRARSPRYSVTTSAPTIGTRPTRTSRPSRTSPRTTAPRPAASSSRTNGSVAASTNIRQTDGRRLTGLEVVRPRGEARVGARAVVEAAGGSRPAGRNVVDRAGVGSAPGAMSTDASGSRRRPAADGPPAFRRRAVGSVRGRRQTAIGRVVYLPPVSYRVASSTTTPRTRPPMSAGATAGRPRPARTSGAR